MARRSSAVGDHRGLRARRGGLLGQLEHEPRPRRRAAPRRAPVDPAVDHRHVRLLSYTDGFDPGYIKGFHDTYPNIDLETSPMGSNEEAVAKITPASRSTS